MSDRQELLDLLLEGLVPAEQITAQLSEFAWESDRPAVLLTRKHALGILKRFVEGDLSNDEVTAWADAIEVREDIDFEVGSPRCCRLSSSNLRTQRSTEALTTCMRVPGDDGSCPDRAIECARSAHDALTSRSILRGQAMRLVSTSITRSTISRAWFDVRRFRLDERAEDEALLAKLLGKPVYADSYLRVQGNPPEPVHGPLLLSRLSPKSFWRIERAAAVSHMVSALQDDLELHADIEIAMARLSAEARFYELHRRPDDEHDASWVFDSFVEVVAIDWSAGYLSLFVAGSD